MPSGNIRRATLFMLAAAIIVLSSCKVPPREDLEKTKAVKTTNSWTVPDSVLEKNPFSIQVAAMAKRANAEEYLSKLKTARFRAFCLAHDNIVGKKIYRIRVGPFRNRNGAEAALSRLRQQGYRQAFVQQHADLIPVAKTSAARAGAGTELPPIKGAKKISREGGCSHPQWSPTGREIAYISESEGQAGLYAVGTGGGAASRIAESSKERRLSEKFSWSPDGKRLAFVAREFNDLFEWADNLYVVSRRGSKPVRIIWQERTTFSIGNICWSPDGERLAVEELPGSGFSGSSGYSRVLILTIAGDQPTAVLEAPAGDLRAAGWPSATGFVYLDSRRTRTITAGVIEDGGLRVMRYDLNKDNASQLYQSPDPANVVQAAYLPKSNAVVFSEVNETPADKRLLRFIDLRSRKATPVLEYGVAGDQQRGFMVTKNEKVVVVEADKLWFINRDSREKSAKLPVQPPDWTIDPSGKQICIARGGELFTLKIADANES